MLLELSNGSISEMSIFSQEEHYGGHTHLDVEDLRY